MACGLHVTWDERLTDYHFGPGHPLAPVRVELTMRLAHEFAGSASTTTPRPRSPGCWDTAPSASPTWRSTRTTATGCRPRSTEGTPAVFELFESGCNPADPVDRAIMATRNAVFPLHGLMPL